MNAISKVSYTHDKLIDVIMAKPRIKQGELALIFGYTQPWISQVMSSDAFRERLAARKAEVVDPEIKASLDQWFPTATESFQCVLDKSLELLKERLEGPKVPDAVILKAAEMGAKALSVGGYGNKQPEPVEKPANDTLERLADRLTGLLEKKRTEVVIDAEIIKEPST